jgi:hypothetical protein
VDYPFVTLRDSGGKRITDARRLPDAGFGRSWAAQWWGFVVLADFTATQAWQDCLKDVPEGPLVIPHWHDLLPQDPNNPAATIAERVDLEIALLIRAAEDERPDALGEILSQSANLFPDFMGVLNITASSHPATIRLMDIANLIGLMAVMRYKGEYNRIRPSQACPALRPAVAMPGHASYPSGHATQASLIARCLGLVVGAAQAPAVTAMAARMARNREIAGLHYRSDTLGGEALAEKLFNVLTAAPVLKRVQAAIDAAQAEWP